MSETIINGIDVSECEYINCCSKKAKCIILQDDISSDSQYCESEPNCYFKQLKRLQEENEELKKYQYTQEYLQSEIEKRQKALEEIREISKQCMTKDLCSIDCDYADRCYIEDEEVPTYDICKLIIEKIDEALNDRD